MTETVDSLRPVWYFLQLNLHELDELPGEHFLKTGNIPQSEPQIRVGIIMPEDGQAQVSIVIPAEPGYLLQSAGDEVERLQSASVQFRAHGNEEITCIGPGPEKADTQFDIMPEGAFEIAPGAGLNIEQVIAGRGFHWRKRIDVTLPGRVTLRNVGGRLLLVNIVRLEHYLMCVATSEMGAACPPALIEAQTIAARSWFLARAEDKHRELGIDVCNDDCCQRYQGTGFLTAHAQAGAETTAGQVLSYGGAVCDARYSKSCGGVTERFETIWGGPGKSYLQALPDAPSGVIESLPDLTTERGFAAWAASVPETFCSPHVVPENELPRYLGGVDESGRYFRWAVTMGNAGLCRMLARVHDIEARRIIDMRPQRRGSSGRLRTLEIYYEDSAGGEQCLRLESEYTIRKTLHEKFLYSSAICIEKQGVKNDEFIFRGCGWGHGVGLCQIGALGMGLRGYDAGAILAHYYPGAELTEIY